MCLLIWPTFAFAALPQGYGNFPAVCHRIIRRDPAHLDGLQTVTAVHSISSSMLIRPAEQGETGVWEALVESVCPRGWRERN